MAIKKLSPRLVCSLSVISDPWKDKNRKHLLIDILVIALCTCLAGGEGWTDCEDYVRSNEDWFRQFRALPHGAPSHDVFREVFMRLDTSQFVTALSEWVQEVRGLDSISADSLSEPRQFSIDGKTIRGSADKANEKSPFHLVSAWVKDLGISMGQIAVGKKSNEIIAIPKLLRTLDVKGAIVSIDAMGCQKRIASQIRRQGGDYVLALKKNQPSLYEQVDDFFSTAEEFNFEDIEYEDYETVEKDHGRIEIRKYTLVTDVRWLEKKGWTGLKSVGRVIRERRANGKVSRETVYHISSLSGKAKTYANAVRKHWGVENKLHWCLDVIFNEDQCRIRAEFSAQNYSALRRVAIAIFNRDKSKDLSMRRKRLKAAWSTNYIQTLIFS